MQLRIVPCSLGIYPKNQQVWKTVAYGNFIQRYDQNGSLIGSNTATGDTSYQDDIEHLPLIESAPSTVSDSLRTAFVTECSSYYTASDETDGIHLSQTKTIDGKLSTAIVLIDRDYLCPVSEEFWVAGEKTMEIDYQYSSLTGHRVATRTETVAYINQSPSDATRYTVDFPNMDFTSYLHLTKRSIVTLTNISLP